jgi:branched-chain amino acid transport system permease protein
MKNFFFTESFWKDRLSFVLGLSFFLAAVLLPIFVRSNYIISVGVTCFLFAAFGVCWNMISGYGGQISWCHAAFVSIGAYTAMIMYRMLGFSPLLSIPVSMAIAFVVATLIGSVSFRYRGPFFSITTIAFAEIVRILLLYFNDLTGGSAGLTMPFTGANALNLMFSNDTPHYYVSIGVLGLMVFITARLEKSKTGYYLKAIKGDEDAAISLGIDTRRTKLRTFQLSGILTAAAGAFYISFINFAQPNGIAGMDFSVRIGSVAIIGGSGTVWGPVVGAFILIPLIEIANASMGAQGGAQLLYGAALIAVVVFQPKGILYFFVRQGSSAQRKKEKRTGDAEKTTQ